MKTHRNTHTHTHATGYSTVSIPCISLTGHQSTQKQNGTRGQVLHGQASNCILQNSNLYSYLIRKDKIHQESPPPPPTPYQASIDCKLIEADFLYREALAVTNPHLFPRKTGDELHPSGCSCKCAHHLYRIVHAPPLWGPVCGCRHPAPDHCCCPLAFSPSCSASMWSDTAIDAASMLKCQLWMP